MGGKAAKERRRLKRLGLPDEGGSGMIEPDKEERKQRPSGLEKGKRRPNLKNNEKFHQNAGRGVNTRSNRNHTEQKKKSKKPKHLKRKLEQLSADGDVNAEEERARIEKQMKELGELKAKRAKRFEEKVRGMAGGRFDEQLFQDLRDKGASLNTILEAVGAKEGAEGSNKKQKKKRQPVDVPNTVAKKEFEAEPRNKNDREIQGIRSPADIREYATLFKRNDENSNNRAIMSDSGVHRQDGDRDGEGHQVDQNDMALSEGASSNNSCSSSSSISDSDSDSSDESVGGVQERTRGRRRRGRKEADAKRGEVNAAQTMESARSRLNDASKEGDAEGGDAQALSQTENKGRRRCIGRRPVTDFIVGKKYGGKVVYVKPFGAFIDIGCHSDTFVHISRCSDGFVDNIDSVLSAGQEIQVRVVEVDRKQKRLTGSLQSDDRIEDERKSVEARKERQKMINDKKAKSNSPVPASTSPSHVSKSRRGIGIDVGAAQGKGATESGQSKQGAEPEDALAELRKIPESRLTHAQLKRLRKLSRRAERRMQESETGISA